MSPIDIGRTDPVVDSIRRMINISIVIRWAVVWIVAVVVSEVDPQVVMVDSGSSTKNQPVIVSASFVGACEDIPRPIAVGIDTVIIPLLTIKARIVAVVIPAESVR
jgi:hypothetical protein